MRKSRCLNCDKEITYLPSQRYGKYCSNKCQGWISIQKSIMAGKASARSCRKFLLETRKYECSICNKSKWLSKSLTLQVDHIDGNSKNSLPSNLRWLCPNCHSQTETWGAKNISESGRRRLKTNKG